MTILPSYQFFFYLLFDQEELSIEEQFLRDCKFPVSIKEIQKVMIYLLQTERHRKRT